MQPIRSLTGLRACAAYSVLIAHSASVSFGSASPALERLAYFGMSLFFVLSGFVIAYNYEDKIRDGGLRAVYGFFVARFARLYPLYALVCWMWFMPSSADKRPIVWLTHVTLTQSWFNTENAVYPATWSISTEWAFYIVFAAVILFFPKVRNSRASLVSVCITAPLILLIIFANRETVLELLPGGFLLHGHGSADLWYPWFIYFCPLVRIAEFVAGALAASVYKGRSANISHGFAAIAAAWCICLLAFGGVVQDTVLADLLPNFAFAPAFVVLILYLTRENISSRVLGSTLAIALGEISYAVYLLQHQYFVKF